MAVVNFRMVGYARVSTQIQETTLQLDALAAAGVEKIYEEKASGSSVERRFVLKKLLEEIQPGQTLVVYKIDRIARSLKDLLRILSLLAEKGATIKSLTEPLDTTSSMGMFVIQILGAVAELERSIIRERSMAGQIAARARGSIPGRRRVLLLDEEAALVADYAEGLHTFSTLGRKYGVSPSVAKRAVYRTTKNESEMKRLKI